MQETQLRALGREDPWRREWQPTPVFLPGEFHGRRSLVGYSPWGHKESDTTERLSTSFQRRFRKHFLWAAFKELIILWKRRHVYKTRQSEESNRDRSRDAEGLISYKAPSRAGLICALTSAFSLVAS